MRPTRARLSLAGVYSLAYPLALLLVGAGLVLACRPDGLLDESLVQILTRAHGGLVAVLLVLLLAAVPLLDRRARGTEAAEAKLQGFVEAIPDSAVVTDAAGRIAFANVQTAALFGYGLTELLGRPLATILPKGISPHEPRSEGPLTAPAGSPARDVREASGRRKDGSTLPLQVTMSRRLRTSDGALTVLVLRDLTKHRQTRAILREREAHLRLVVEQMPAILWTTDARLQITSTMGAGLAAVGLEPSEVVGMTMLENLGTDDLEATPIAAHLRALRGESLTYEMEWRGRTFQVRVDPLRGSDKRITGTIGIVVDVTARKQTVAELKARARQQAAVAELGQRALAGQAVDALMNEAVHLVRRTLEVGSCRVLEALSDGRGFRVRAAAGAPAGQSPGTVLGADDEAQAAYALSAAEPVLVGDLRAERRFRPSSVLLESGAVSGLSAPLPGARRPLGVLDVHADHERTFTQDDLNFLQAVANTLAAAVQRKQAEEAQARLVAILEATTDFVAIAGTDHRVLYLNRAARALTGLGDDEDVTRLTVAELYPEATRAALLNDCLPCALRQGVWSGEMPLRDRAGEAVAFSQVILAHRPSPEPPAEARGAAKAGGRGVEFFSVLGRDLTERQRLEEQMRQGQKMEAVGRLAGGVAHDFNNLLTVITGYSSFLESQLPAGQEAHTFATEIRRAGERAASLTRQLLAFSRKQMLSPRVINLNGLVTDTHKLLCRLIGEHIELVTELEPTLHPVKVDPGQVEQILMNLAVNARDAMREGGRITVSTANVTLGPTYTREYPEVRPGPYVLLRVSDTGCGMTPEVQAHIFEPFFTTKEQGKGTGLGLATVYGIVKQSGGHIDVQSQPGRGTTFRVYLPRSQDRAARAEAAAPAEAPPGTEMILLAEDEEQVRQLAGALLRAKGYTVLEASTGEEALDVAAAHPGRIDLLISDVVMPRMGGVRLAQRLAAVRPETRVLFMSGYTDSTLIHDGLTAGKIECLLKPFAPEDLALKVREILDRDPQGRISALSGQQSTVSQIKHPLVLADR